MYAMIFDNVQYSNSVLNLYIFAHLRSYNCAKLRKTVHAHAQMCPKNEMFFVGIFKI